MASIDEVMSHKNRDPKWMTDSIQPEEVLKKKHKDPTWMTGSNEKQASQPQAPKAPKASAIPQMNFKVHMCCNKCEEKAREEVGEVPGVVSVITDARQDLVTVLGGADSAAVLKKLKRHVDKKATYWPAEVPVPKVAVAPNVSAGGMNVGKGERNSQIGEKGGMKEMRERRPLDPRMVDPREVGGMHVREMQQPINAREMGEYQYAPADRREMYPVDPRTFDIRGGDPRDYRFSNPQTMHAPPPELYYNSRSREADPRVVQPKESYFSDYRPSQSYPANYSNSASYYDEDDMSPYHMNQAVY
ncbi:unnamed protein product [Sphagnum balticum]